MANQLVSKVLTLIGLLILAQQFRHRREVAGFILVRRATHLNFGWTVPGGGLRHLRATTVDPSEGSFIFTRNGTFIDPEYFSKWIALPLVKSASKGSIKRFHDLRHFYASMLIAQGENQKNRVGMC